MKNLFIYLYVLLLLVNVGCEQQDKITNKLSNEVTNDEITVQLTIDEVLETIHEKVDITLVLQDTASYEKLKMDQYIFQIEGMPSTLLYIEFFQTAEDREKQSRIAEKDDSNRSPNYSKGFLNISVTILNLDIQITSEQRGLVKNIIEALEFETKQKKSVSFKIRTTRFILL